MLLLIEPFYGGSHKQLIDLITSNMSPDSYTMCTLSDAKWHWRARVGALALRQKVLQIDGYIRTLFASSVLNLAELLALCPNLQKCNKILYFHENQLNYPVNRTLEADFQYGYNQILSCMVADTVLFNSKYNMRSFLDKIQSFLKMAPDLHKTTDIAKIKIEIEEKSKVLYFPMVMDHVKFENYQRNDNTLHIVWPHRWEHDKDPDTFFHILQQLSQEKLQFKVIILGQGYGEIPDCFEKSKSWLQDECRIVYWGCPESNEKYFEFLQMGHVIQNRG